MSSSERVSPFTFLHRSFLISSRAGSLARETVYLNHPALISDPQAEGVKKRVFKQEMSPGTSHSDIAYGTK